MTATRRHCVVWVTVPDRATARRLARVVLEARAVACVNLIPGVESQYWWKGKLETSRELLLVMKTVTGRLKTLERLVKAAHPYETPEFVVTPLKAGSAPYLAWIDANVGTAGSESGLG